MLFLPRARTVLLGALLAATGLAVCLYWVVGELTGWSGMGGSTSPAAVSSLWIGDSYTAGLGAADRASSESCLTASLLGWQCRLDAQAGTGFVADGHAFDPGYGPLASRLARTLLVRPAPDVVIVDAGRADRSVSTAALSSAVTSYFARLRHGFPHAHVVVVLPWSVTSRPADLLTTRRAIASAARRQGFTVLDPLAEHWVPQLATLTLADRQTPDATGHRAVAVALTADLRRTICHQVRCTP